MISIGAGALFAALFFEAPLSFETLSFEPDPDPDAEDFFDFFFVFFFFWLLLIDCV